MVAVQNSLTPAVVATSKTGPGLWAATQWTAAHLGYDPALGSSRFTVLSTPIYVPWNVFHWWIVRRDRAKRQPTTYGSPRWAVGQDIKIANLLGDHGIVLGAFNGQLLRHDGPEHALTVAPTPLLC